jgi:hypothetical protein
VRPWLALLIMALAGSYGRDPALSVTGRPPVLQRPHIRINPSGRAPLTAVLDMEYRIDPMRGSIAQLWSYGRPGDEIFYSAAVGSAYPLPATGNVLVTDGARITDGEGRPTDNGAGARRWARIVEVTRTRPARKVFELVVGNDAAPSAYGWSVYRARRLDASSFTTRP